MRVDVQIREMKRSAETDPCIYGPFTSDKSGTVRAVGKVILQMMLVQLDKHVGKMKLLYHIQKSILFRKNNFFFTFIFHRERETEHRLGRGRERMRHRL